MGPLEGAFHSRVITLIPCVFLNTHDVTERGGSRLTTAIADPVLPSAPGIELVLTQPLAPAVASRGSHGGSGHGA